MQFISFHTAINYQSAQFVERILLSQIGHENPGVTILLCTSGGDSGAATGLHHLMRALPYPVHIHAAGMCAMGWTPPLSGIFVPEWLRWNHKRGGVHGED